MCSKKKKKKAWPFLIGGFVISWWFLIVLKFQLVLLYQLRILVSDCILSGDSDGLVPSTLHFPAPHGVHVIFLRTLSARPTQPLYSVAFTCHCVLSIRVVGAVDVCMCICVFCLYIHIWIQIHFGLSFLVWKILSNVSACAYIAEVWVYFMPAVLIIWFLSNAIEVFRRDPFIFSGGNLCFLFFFFFFPLSSSLAHFTSFPCLPDLQL